MNKQIVISDNINCLMCRNSRETTMVFLPWYDSFTFTFQCVNCGAPGAYGDVDAISDIFYNAETQTCWVDGGPNITVITCENFRVKVKPE